MGVEVEGGPVVLVLEVVEDLEGEGVERGGMGGGRGGGCYEGLDGRGRGRGEGWMCHCGRWASSWLGSEGKSYG